MFINLNTWKYWDKNNISVTAKYVVCNVCVCPFIDGMLAWWINEASLNGWTNWCSCQARGIWIFNSEPANLPKRGSNTSLLALDCPSVCVCLVAESISWCARVRVRQYLSCCTAESDDPRIPPERCSQENRTFTAGPQPGGQRDCCWSTQVYTHTLSDDTEIVNLSCSRYPTFKAMTDTHKLCHTFIP